MGDANDAGPEADASKPGKKKAEVSAPPPDALLWTFGEVAYTLRVSVHSVRRLVDSGQLPTSRVTVGGKRLVDRDDVRAYIRGSKTVARPGAPDEGARCERRERAGRDMLSAAKADWNTGEDLLGLDSPGPGRPRKEAGR